MSILPGGNVGKIDVIFILSLSTDLGCSGGINGLAAVLGGPLCELHGLARAGQWDEAMALQRRLVNIDLLVGEPAYVCE